MATLVLSWRLAETDHCMPSVMRVIVLPSTTMAFLTNVCETHKSTSPSAVQVKNRRKPISSEEKLDVISPHKKREHNMDTCHNVRFAHNSLCMIRDNVDRIKKSAKSGLKRLCNKTTTILLQWTVPKIVDVSLTFFALGINMYVYIYIYILYRNVCILYRNVYLLYIQ